MATIEEAREAVRRRLAKYKIQTPIRVAYLGDGRGFSASNMYPPGEPDKVWARENQDGSKPFKLLNRNPDVKVSFNAPVLVGYPESDPDNEQILGTHWAGISLATNASAIGGVGAHHTQHEWGGGDEVSVDPRMFLPGLTAPTVPASMAVRVLAFTHHVVGWKRYDGGTTDDLSQFKPSGTDEYRYVLITLDPDPNAIRLHPGNVFEPDLSIDSIISNQANNTFRHIPRPPGDEIPLGVVLLRSTTATVNWNVSGTNNLMPMRLLLGAPMKNIFDRLDSLESATGISTIPTTGGAQGLLEDGLPGTIDGQNKRILHKRAPAADLPVLMVGEIGVATDTSSIYLGGEDGVNTALPTGGGGADSLGGLSDVNIGTMAGNQILQYVGGTWVPVSYIRSIDGTFGAGLSPLTILTSNETAVSFGNNDDTVLWNPAQGTVKIEWWGENVQVAEFDLAGTGEILQLRTNNHASAMQVDVANNQIKFAASVNDPLLVFDYEERTAVFDASKVRFANGAAASAINISDNGEVVFGGEGEGNGVFGLDTFNGLATFGQTAVISQNGGNFYITEDLFNFGTGGGGGKFFQVTGGQGALSASPTMGGADYFVYQNNGNANMSLVGDTSAQVKFYHAGASGPAFGINYNTATSRLIFLKDNATVNWYGTEGWVFNNPGYSASNFRVAGDLNASLLFVNSDVNMVGIKTDDQEGSETFHVVGADGAVSDLTALVARDHMVISNNQNSFLAFYSDHDGQTGIRLYNDGTANVKGYVVWNQSASEMQFGIDSALRYQMDSGAFYPNVDDARDLGKSGNRWDDVYATNGTIQTSDERIKKYISESKLGIDFINSLRPVRYKFKDKDLEEVFEDKNGTPDEKDPSMKYTKVKTKKKGLRYHYGLIAQEVMNALAEHNVETSDFAGFVYDEESDLYGLRYTEFIAPMMKAIQELSAQNEALQAQVQEMQERINQL